MKSKKTKSGQNSGLTDINAFHQFLKDMKDIPLSVMDRNALCGFIYTHGHKLNCQFDNPF